MRKKITPNRLLCAPPGLSRFAVKNCLNAVSYGLCDSLDFYQRNQKNQKDHSSDSLISLGCRRGLRHYISAAPNPEPISRTILTFTPISQFLTMKRKLSSSPVSMADWLAFKPYNAATPYDKFYLDLANEVFNYFNHPESDMRDMFERRLLVKASVALVSHFEDFINELGLWSAFVRKQKELYGWYLPFYDLSEYDEEYINQEDYGFLLWHFLQNGAGKTINPKAEPLLAAAGFCYELFEPLIDEAPVNDFYDKWFGFGEEIEFFPLKNRLQWLAFDSYLFGLEIGDRWTKAVEESFSQKNSVLPPDKFAYLIQDDFLYIKRSSLCALTMAEWMAEWKGLPGIKKFGHRVGGFFEYEGYEGKYVNFRYLSSKRLFPIREESADFPKHEMKPGNEIAFFNAVEWKDEWWLTGIFLTYPADQRMAEEMKVNPLNQNFYGQTAETQQKIREITADMEAGFLEFFGDRLVFFDSEKEMNEAFDEQTHWWNKYKTKDPGDRPPSPYLEKMKIAFEQLHSGLEPVPGPWAAYFEPGEGVNMSPAIPDFVKFLEKENLEPKESTALFFSFFRECSPFLAHLLASRYSLRNLRSPVIPEPGHAEKYFDFFLRYYNPGAFGEPKPNVSLAPEE